MDPEYAKRIGVKIDDLLTIGTLAAGIIYSHDLKAIRDGIEMIQETAERDQ
jgi:hypothetical protein